MPLWYDKGEPRKMARAIREIERRAAFSIRYSGSIRTARPKIARKYPGTHLEERGRYRCTLIKRKGSSALPRAAVEIDSFPGVVKKAPAEKASGFQESALQRARQMNRMKTE